MFSFFRRASRAEKSFSPVHQGQRLLSFQLLFTGQDFIQQGADRFFRLRAFKTVHRLAVLEQINRRDGAQTKL